MYKKKVPYCKQERNNKVRNKTILQSELNIINTRVYLENYLDSLTNVITLTTTNQMAKTVNLNRVGNTKEKKR